MSGPGLYDPTTIMNADELNRAMREGWIKLAFYLISFFYYLYRYVVADLFSVTAEKLLCCPKSLAAMVTKYCEIKSTDEL